MRFERNVTKRSFEIITIVEKALQIIFWIVFTILLVVIKKFFQEDIIKSTVLTGVTISFILEIPIIVIRFVLREKMKYNFAYTIKLEGDEVVITDDYGKAKRIGKEFIIVGKFRGKYRLLLREGDKLGISIYYNGKLLKYLKKINPNCMGKRLKKL